MMLMDYLQPHVAMNTNVPCNLESYKQDEIRVDVAKVVVMMFDLMHLEVVAAEVGPLPRPLLRPALKPNIAILRS